MLQSLAEARQKPGLEVLYKVEAGIVLTGAETKSSRQGNLKLGGAYLKFIEGEPYLVGLRIGRYGPAGGASHEELRARKVLLKKREAEKIFGLLSQKGLTCLATEIYLKERLIKVQLAVARVLKKFEKKKKTLEKELDREQERELRGYKM